ncbi:preprotein translocase subunit SecG [Sphingomonas jatrophae]|uniref:Protein-export membrane protein SecG n=1 Tax=Sphingomonas jatrophae TaxID=1166337 RepID=A0A1I6JE36_9SPHN|nr:protein translocase, SecG subunit [Sphingomonas jatrophae]
MLFTFLLVIHALIAAALVGVILMQRSEGGGLGMGGSPTGLMSARGAADFLTRTTTILAAIFVVMSIGLAALASVQNRPRTIDSSLARTPAAGVPPLAPAAPAAVPGAVPFEGDPVAGAATAVPSSAPAPAPTPAATPAPAAEPKAETPRRREAATTTGAPNSSLAAPARTERSSTSAAPARTERSTPPAAEPKVDSTPAPAIPVITPPGVPAATTGNSSTPQ